MYRLLLSVCAGLGIILGAPAGVSSSRAAEFKISPDSPFTQAEAKIGSRGSRGLVATWNIFQSGAYGFDVVVQRITAQGAKIGDPVFLTNLALYDQLARGVVGLGDGSYVVVWDSDTGSGFDVMAQRFSAAGVKIGNSFRVNSTVPGDQGFAAIAALSNGGFVIVWSGNGVYGQRYNAAGAKLGGQFKINTSAYAQQNRPQVAALRNGGFVVAWASKQDAGNTNFGIRAQRFSAAAVKLGPELQVNTFTPNDQGSPQIAAFGNSGFVVAWVSARQDGAGAGVYAQLFAPSGGKRGAELRVNTTRAGDQDGCVVAVLGNNKFVVLWEDPSDGSGSGVFGQRYTSAGAKIGGQFRVNETTAGSQSRPTIAAHLTTGFAAAWDSRQLLGGIFGKAFAQ